MVDRRTANRKTNTAIADKCNWCNKENFAHEFYNDTLFKGISLLLFIPTP